MVTNTEPEIVDEKDCEDCEHQVSIQDLMHLSEKEILASILLELYFLRTTLTGLSESLSDIGNMGLGSLFGNFFSGKKE